MIVTYDHQIFSYQRTGGISRYFCEIASLLHKDDDFKVDIPLLVYNNLYLNGMDCSGYFLGNINFRGKTRLIYKANMILTKYKMKFQNSSFDIAHPTYYDPYILDYLGGKPMVLTIYDMTHEKFPEFFPPNDKTTENKRRLASRADRILAISESTKRDVVEIFNIPEDKVVVTHLASSFDGIAHISNDRICAERYILFVGSRVGYKNFNHLVIAMGAIQTKHKDILLLCIGGGAFTQKEEELLAKHKVKATQLDASDSMLASAYSHAEVFVFPSLYEGFGLPVLEAFSFGCPVCISNTSSLPEVAGGGALMFDPLSSENMIDTILTVLEDNSLAANMAQRGRNRLKEFSWAKTTQATKLVYKELI